MNFTLCLIAFQALYPSVNQPPASVTPQTSLDRLMLLAQANDCSPRRYCSKSIYSCEDAYWFYNNCSWGGSLDRDNDGVPCENLCSGG